MNLQLDIDSVESNKHNNYLLFKQPNL